LDRVDLLDALAIGFEVAFDVEQRELYVLSREVPRVEFFLMHHL
jgi:hypothetical protein